MFESLCSDSGWSSSKIIGLTSGTYIVERLLDRLLIFLRNWLISLVFVIIIIRIFKSLLTVYFNLINQSNTDESSLIRSMRLKSLWNNAICARWMLLCWQLIKFIFGTLQRYLDFWFFIKQRLYLPSSSLQSRPIKHLFRSCSGWSRHFFKFYKYSPELESTLSFRAYFSDGSKILVPNAILPTKWWVLYLKTLDSRRLF